MDDYSPVTFDSSLNAKPDEVDHQDNSQLDYIEEAKEVISGIKVRAAKLPKLIEILINSFGE
jgi:hypothetical protein